MMKSMSNNTKIFIIFVVLSASILFFISQLNKLCYHATRISIDIAYGQEDRYQLFYDSGSGFHEKESVNVYYSGVENQSVVFIIPNAKFNKFRIDPGTNQGVVKIKQICIEHLNSLKCWGGQDILSDFKFSKNVNNQRLENDLLILDSTGNDPYFEYQGNLYGEIDFELNRTRLWAFLFGMLLLVILISCVLFYFNRIDLKTKAIFASKSISNFIKPRNIFLFFAMSWGALTVFITPPFQVPDEPNHFFRSYQIATGKIFPEIRNNQVGGFIPLSFINTYDLFSGIAFYPERKIGFDKFGKSLVIPLDPEIKTYACFPNTGLYTPIPYIPQSFAIIIGKFFNAPPLIILYLGRLLNLFCWIFLISLAIKITPICKWLFLLLALTPMSVFQASSVSADVLTNGVAFLFIAAVFRLAFDKNKSFSKYDLILLIFLLVVLTLSKYVYSFLIILYFLIPINKSGNIKNHILNALPLFILTGLSLAIGNHFVKNIYESIDPAINFYGNGSGIPQSTNVDMQIQFIISHVGTYFKTILLSFWTFKSFIISSFIGNLGWLDTPLPDYYILLAISMILLTALSDGNKDVILSIKSKIILLIGFISVAFCLSTLLYLSWTPIGDSLISSLQGRYFIPVAPLVFSLFYNRYLKLSENILVIISIIFIMISFLVMNYSLISRYYLSSSVAF